ncbi:DUF3822 family protein [Flavobacteriaceae bacterium LSUCC0859]|nr:DUF3822 family protein [Flavobacteriaceae bacterium LSUCC0859]
MNPTRSYEHTRLSIQLSLNGLSFCITDTVSQELIAAKRVHFDTPIEEHAIVENLSKFLQTHKLLEHSYESVIVIQSNPLFNIVPKALFDESHIGNYLKFNTQILPSDEMAFDLLDPVEIAVVYIPFTAANNLIFDHFGPFEYKHDSTVHISEILSIQHQSDEVDGYFHLDQNTLHMTVIENRKLLFHNQFSIKSPEDFLYFILFSLEQLGIDPQKLQAHFYGDISADNPYFKMASSYLNNCLIFRPSHEQSISENLLEEDFDRILLNA